jgi:RES domain-containing protein
MTGRTHRLGLPVVALRQKHFWRCLPKQYARTVLEAGPSFTRERRYSVRGEFGALYFSSSKELSLSEVASRAGQDTEVLSCVEFEVTLDRLVDLTRPETRAALQVQLEDLIRPRTSADAYQIPQSIARRVYQERLNGLLSPSVHNPEGKKRGWLNLVLYPANLIRASIREVHVEEVTSIT